MITCSATKTTVATTPPLLTFSRKTRRREASTFQSPSTADRSISKFVLCHDLEFVPYTVVRKTIPACEGSSERQDSTCRNQWLPDEKCLRDGSCKRVALIMFVYQFARFKNTVWSIDVLLVLKPLGVGCHGECRSFAAPIYDNATSTELTRGFSSVQQKPLA